MSDQLRFRFGLDDGVSGTAKTIKTGIEGIKKAFADVAASAKVSTAAWKDHFKAVGEFNEKLNFSLELFHKIAEPIVAVSEKVFDLGKEFTKATYEAGEFAERSHIAFTAMLGSGKAADDVMKSIVSTASTLPITTQQAFGYATSLITGGFKGGDLRTLLTAVSDIGALNPANQAGAQEELVSHLRRIKGEGFLDERSLRSLAGIGINEATLSARIGHYLGIPIEQVRDAVGKRKVSVDVGIASILDTIKATEGGKIGNLSGQLAETSGGLISTIKSRFFEAAMGLSEGPGFSAFTGFLKNIRDLTDQTSTTGQRLKTTIGDTFNSIFTNIFGRFAGATGRSTVEGIFDKIMDAAKQLPGIINAVFDDISGLFEGFFGGDVAKGWKNLFNPDSIRALRPAFEGIGSALRIAVNVAGQLAEVLAPVLKILGYGAAIGSGANVGATVGTRFGPLGTVIGAVGGGLAGGLGAAYLGSGLTTPEIPGHAEGGITTGAHVAMVGEAGPELIMPLPAGGLSAVGGGGGGGRSVSVGEIHVHVDGSKHGGEDQALKEQVREGTLQALHEILEALNLEMGAGAV